MLFWTFLHSLNREEIGMKAECQSKENGHIEDEGELKEKWYESNESALYVKNAPKINTNLK